MVLVDDYVVCDMQTQACARAGRLRREKRFKNALPDLTRDPRSAVDDFDCDGIAFSVCALSKLSLTLYGVDRVVDKVGPHLVEL